MAEVKRRGAATMYLVHGVMGKFVLLLIFRCRSTALCGK